MTGNAAKFENKGCLNSLSNGSNEIVGSAACCGMSTDCSKIVGSRSQAGCYDRVSVQVGARISSGCIESKTCVKRRETPLEAVCQACFLENRSDAR
ncbi:hypothetical protein [Paraburkholderia bannensis]|uniref:hypothetical protein n=1 Tax=Paraburkholderia bannensis TaxID=765414 RepID=UPI002AB791F5|nr:hypothetical protein [Paraburkholderia bannensis]